MVTVQVKLDTIETVKQFSNLMNQYPIECDLTSGRYTVDAKSIMGVFSLDLAKPLELHVHGEVSEEMMTALKPYLAD